jgi:hypothetical protein
MRDCGAYIGAIGDRQAIRPVATSDIKPLCPDDGASGLPRFHQNEPFLKRMSRAVQVFRAKLIL